MTDKKILIVDDESSIRKLIGIQLTSMGYKYLEAEDGVDALKQFESNLGLIKLLITDLRMPVRDGYLLTRDVKKIDPDFPVIWITASDNKTSYMENYRKELCIEDVLIKPYKSDDLEKLVFKYF